MHVDFLIIGGGISGLALAAELAAEGSTLVIEAEPMPGTHATGRSAALFTPNFGPLARASRGLIVDRLLPEDLVAAGITATAHAPGRVGIQL